VEGGGQKLHLKSLKEIVFIKRGLTTAAGGGDQARLSHAEGEGPGKRDLKDEGRFTKQAQEKRWVGGPRPLTNPRNSVEGKTLGERLRSKLGRYYEFFWKHQGKTFVPAL